MIELGRFLYAGLLRDSRNKIKKEKRMDHLRRFVANNVGTYIGKEGALISKEIVFALEEIFFRTGLPFPIETRDESLIERTIQGLSLPSVNPFLREFPNFRTDYAVSLTERELRRTRPGVRVLNQHALRSTLTYFKDERRAIGYISSRIVPQNGHYILTVNSLKHA